MKRRDFLGTVLVPALVSACGGSTSDQSQGFVVLHTNDWHSHDTGSPNENDHAEAGGAPVISGSARVGTHIAQARAQANGRPVLVLDAGDVAMGTLFSAIGPQVGADYQLMKVLGYDAVAIGNHDLDYGPQALADTILAAANSAVGVPQILIANWTLKDVPAAAGLKQLEQQGLIKPYTVIERGGLRFGVFGLLGKDAQSVTVPIALAAIDFADPIASAKHWVDVLRNTEHVDVVIALSHSGVVVAKDWTVSGEDVDLAQKVPGIDLIVGGHTHTTLVQPKLVRKTPIVQADCFEKYVGRIDMCRATASDAWTMNDYALLPVDQTVAADPSVAAVVSALVARINATVLKSYGWTFAQALAQVDGDFTSNGDDPTRGNLVTDAVRAGLGATTDIAFATGSGGGGALRDDILKSVSGQVTVSDLFRVSPLGMGWDGQPGHPIIRMYLYASEIRGAMNAMIFAILSGLGDDSGGKNYVPHISGARVYYNPNGEALNYVTEIDVGTPGHYQPVDISTQNKTLYPVVTNLYNGLMVASITKISGGLIQITPKDKNGNPVTDVSTLRVLRPDGLEYKEWQLLNQFVEKYPKRVGQLANLLRADFSEQRVIARSPSRVQ